jgi:Zn-dependent peptidase ImmA (M78 family)/transcriptional regulator with XRE-family HTH domain
MDEQFNADMLILARESRGMSQGDLARRMGVTQGKVSKYENGMLAVTEDDFVKICDALGYTKDFFLQRDKVYGLGSSFLFHRQKKAAPITIQKRVQAQINILRMQVDRLLRSVEMEPAQEFARLDIDQFDGDAAKVAKIVRATWQLPMGPVASVTASIESAGGIVLHCDFGTSHIDAAHLWLPDLPPLFFVNRDLSGDRLRWTLAHEVGHAVMHRNPTGDVEDEANSFASEFLFPAEEARQHLAALTLERAAALKPVWGMSMAAIIMRAADVGCIPESRYRRLFTSLSAQGYRKNEPFPVAKEEPRVMRELVEVHRASLGYDDFDLARLLFAPDPQFFAPGLAAAMLRVGGEPFFAISPRGQTNQESGYRLVM